MKDSGRRAIAALVALAVCVPGVLAVGASAAKAPKTGIPDPTFGKNGVVQVKPGGKDHFFGTGVAAARDGGVVQSVMSTNEIGRVVKYTNRGHRDRDFGKDGIAQLRFKAGKLNPRDILVGSRGRILVAGEGSPDGDGWYGTIASLKPNGKPNGGFGNGGIALPKKLKGFVPMELAFAPKGKIVAVGHFGGMPSANTAVVRFTARGRLDRSFSGDGLKRYSVAGNQLGRTVAVDRRGRIVIGSPGGRKYRHVHDIVRLNPNGSFDRSFGSNGRKKLNPTRNAYDEIRDVAIDRQGRILVAGASTSYQGTIVRLRPNGAIDRSFGKRGVTGIAWFVPASLALDRQGRTVAIGYYSSGNSDETGQVVRLGRQGGKDARFSGSVSRTTLLEDGFVDRKGRVVAGGNNGYRTLAAARLLNR